MTDERRTPCAVPFCTRSKRGGWTWWLCSDHKKMVSLVARAQHRKAKAMCKKRGWIEQTKTSWWTTSERASRIMDRAGRLYCRSAIKRATGL